ncbi:MAG TPA: hypothetical protein VFO73_05585 [Candidatus Limnocylindrales bacterium]|nr:hypothetical protein [Candidatus Limnocylindrales bacterium]
MSSPTRTLPIDSLRNLSGATKLCVTGLVLASTGMLLQIAAGSTLYPSLAGPIVLLATAAIVAFVPGRWTRYLGLVVPLVLGVGALVAAVMTGDFIDQLTDLTRVGIFVGSVVHVVGLVAAVSGGVGMVLGRGTGGERER